MAVLLAVAGVWGVVFRRGQRRARLPEFRWPAPWVLPASAATGVAAFVAALGILGVPAAAAALALLAALVPPTAHAARARRRRELVADAWPDILARLRSRIAAGAALPDAFTESLIDSPEPLAVAAPMIDEAVSYGDGFSTALERLRSDLAAPTADRVLATIAAAHRSGGNRVGAVLSALAESVGDELRLRKAHHSALTEQRLTAGVAMLAPWVLLGLTIATNPQAGATYRTGEGALLIAVGLTATAAGYALARHIARLSRVPRVFE